MSLADVERLTSDLRENSDDFWSRLRYLLSDRGVEPGATVLCDIFPDDTCFEFGLLITPEGRAIQFGYDYIDTGDLSRGVFTEWNDLTDRYQATPYRDQLAAGLRLWEQSQNG